MCFESFSNTVLNIKPNSDYHVKKNHFIDSIPVPFHVYAVLATIRFLCWPPPGRRCLPLLRLPRELLHRRSARRLAADSRVGRARPAALVVGVASSSSHHMVLPGASAAASSAAFALFPILGWPLWPNTRGECMRQAAA